jgi:hypothetical protein
MYQRQIYTQRIELQTLKLPLSHARVLLAVSVYDMYIGN